MKRRKKIQYQQHPYSPTRPYSQTTVIPVEIVKLEDCSYHLLVTVEIDGIQGDMIIDTGASVTVVDQKMFPDKANDESTVQLQSGSVSGQLNDVHLLKTDHFKIGGRKMKNLQLAGIDLDYVNEMYKKHLNRKIIGLLGCDFCVRYNVVIDYRNKTLSMNLSKNQNQNPKQVLKT